MKVGKVMEKLPESAIEIERSVPLKVHKNLVISFLHQHPEDLLKLSPSFEGTAQDFIDLLRDHPGEWIIDGKLESQD